MIIDKSMMRIFLDFECKYNTREQNCRICVLLALNVTYSRQNVSTMRVSTMHMSTLGYCHPPSGDTPRVILCDLIY